MDKLNAGTSMPADALIDAVSLVRELETMDLVETYTTNGAAPRRPDEEGANDG